MNISLNWIAEMLGHSLDPAETAGRLTMIGAAVDAVEPLHQDLGDVIVARVESVARHPNADRLSLCQVNDGRSVVEVVCGAPNVVAGKKYPYAPVGSTLPGGLKLEARKIRGVLSNGMLCSARELGLGEDHAGILELTTDAAPGMPFVQVLSIADHRLVLDVTANRPDLLSHKGVARELAAGDGSVLRLAAIPGFTGDGPPVLQGTGVRGEVDGVDVVIEDAEGCPRYAVAVIRGVTIGPSPEWLQARLRNVGARSINNVVDATNYILYELNQPLHAFDLAKIGGPTVIVRRARPGEVIVTLDGVTRALTAEMTAICDVLRPVAIAGVMGGVDSEVTAKTTDVLLECAWFDPRRVRGTRGALRLSTEASYRFERGIDLQSIPATLRRAVGLIITIAGGRATGALDVYPSPVQEPLIFLRPGRVEHLLGMAVPRADIERYLTSVGFAVAPRDERLAIQVPGWRPDVTREVDLIEEVARLKGYDTFPVELRPLRPSAVPEDPSEVVKARLRSTFSALGLREARSYPLGKGGDPDAVELTNPLSADDAYLRRYLLTGLTRATEHNWAARQRDIRLYEIGTVFRRREGRPDEREHFAAVISGSRTPPHWTSAGKSEDVDLWDLKNLLDEAVRQVSSGWTVLPDGSGWLVKDSSGDARGWGRPIDADRPAWAAPLFGLELELEISSRSPHPYRSLPLTPPVERDVALVLPPGVAAQQVEAITRRTGGALLESVAVFDEYRSAELQGRSVAWRLVFRAPDRTLRDEEVDQMVGRTLAALKEELNVRIRES